MKKTNLLQSLLPLLICGFISCQTSNTKDVSVVGKWLSTTSETLCEGNKRADYNDNISNTELQFYSNGKVSNTITTKSTLKTTVFSGSYTLQGDILTMAYDDSATDTFKIVAIESKSMVLKTAKIGYSCSTTLPFEKQ